LSGYTLTGERESQPIVPGGGLVTNTASVGQESELYVSPYAATAERVEGIRKSRSQATIKKVASQQFPIADLRLLRVLLERASECVARLSAAAEDDQMERGIAGHELLEFLEELWLLRSLRGREWQRLVSLLQSALFRTSFERFTPQQCRCVGLLVNDYLTDSALTKDKMSRAMRILREAQINPWDALSESGTPTA
jgi:hypothetical protein